MRAMKPNKARNGANLDRPGLQESQAASNKHQTSGAAVIAASRWSLVAGFTGYWLPLFEDDELRRSNGVSVCQYM